jgi:hypothetical protein
LKKISALIFMFLLLVQLLSIFVLKAHSADYPHDPRGEITDVDIVWPVCYQGEKQEVYVEFRNPTSTTYHYLVAVNIYDSNNKVVYDSHTVGEDKHGYVDGGRTVAWGPWWYTVPLDAPTGTYHVLAGLRLYPWDPELDYRGLSWCEPEETFTVKPSHEYIADKRGGPNDSDGDGYYDTVWIEVKAGTNAMEEVDVEVYGKLKDPNGRVVNEGGSGVWSIPPGVLSWGPRFYISVPSGSPVGRYQVDLYLYDASHRNQYPTADPEHVWVNAYSYDPLYPKGYAQPDRPPVLSNGYVTPPSGDTSTIFTYYVTYYDPEGVAPQNPKQLCIDGDQWHAMGLHSGSPSNGVYKSMLTLSAGSHNFYFKFSDGVNTVYLPTSGTYSGPSVNVTNQPPVLSNGYVTPPSGDTSTIFTYYVTYYDPEGVAPQNPKQLCIDGDQWHAMGLHSGSPSNGVYKCQITLSKGTHTYYFKFSDGVNTVYFPISAPSVPYSGPTVDGLTKKRQLTMHPSDQDMPSLIVVDSGVFQGYFLAYQSWETGDAYNGDIFVEKYDRNWNLLKRVQATNLPSYQDSPSLALVFDGYNYYLKLAYVSTETGNYDIFVQAFDLDLNFVAKKQVTTSVYDQDFPSIIFDGSQSIYIAYQSWETGSSYGGDIFVEKFNLNLDSLNKVRITTETSYQDRPSLLYNPETGIIYIAYVSNETGNLDIFMKQYDSNLNYLGRKLQLTTHYTTQFGPSLAPLYASTYPRIRGFQLAYYSWETGTVNNRDIFVEDYDLDCNRLRKTQVTNDQFFSYMPSITPSLIPLGSSWCPGYVAYVSDEKGNWDIWLQELAPAPAPLRIASLEYPSEVSMNQKFPLKVNVEYSLVTSVSILIQVYEHAGPLLNSTQDILIGSGVKPYTLTITAPSAPKPQWQLNIHLFYWNETTWVQIDIKSAYIKVNVTFNIRLESKEDNAASSNRGTIKFDGIDYSSLPTTINKEAKAYAISYLAASGYEFLCWETSGGISVASSSSSSTTATVTGDGTLRAVYKAVFDFNILSSPSSQTVAQGDSTTYDVTVTLVSGSTQTVSLSISGLPSYTSYSFTPSSGYPTFSSKLKITTTSSTPTGTYTLTITGSGGGKTHSTTVKLNVIKAGRIYVITRYPDGSPFVSEFLVLFDSNWNELARVNPTSEAYTFQDIAPGNYIIQAGVGNVWVGADLNILVQAGQTSDVSITITYDRSLMSYVGLIEEYFPVWRFSKDEKWFPTSFYFDGDANVENNRENYQKKVGRYNDKYAYVHVVDKDPSILEIQYWLYYAYNPGVRGLLGAHDHDWEKVFICFDKTLNKPLYVYFSQHYWFEQFVSWGDVEKRGFTHPVVYVANGSHASYPSRPTLVEYWEDGGVELTAQEFNWIIVGDKPALKKEEFSLLYHVTKGKSQYEPYGNYWPDHYPPNSPLGSLGATADPAPWLRDVWNEVKHGVAISISLDKEYRYYYPDEKVNALIKIENHLDKALDDVEIDISIYDPDGVEINRIVYSTSLRPNSEVPMRKDIWTVPTFVITGAYGITATLKSKGITYYESLPYQYVFFVTKSPVSITPDSTYEVAWITLERTAEKVFIHMVKKSLAGVSPGGIFTVLSLAKDVYDVVTPKTETFIQNPNFPMSSTVPLVNWIEAESGATIYLISKVYTGYIADGIAKISIEYTPFAWHQTDVYFGQQTFEIKGLENWKIYTIKFTKTFFKAGTYTIRTTLGTASSEAKIVLYPSSHPAYFTYYSTDLNGDGTVNIIDIAIVAKAFGAKYNETDGLYWHDPPCKYCPHAKDADLNEDKIINIMDIAIVARDYGKTT